MARILYTLALFVSAALAYPAAESGYIAPLHIASVPAHDLINDTYIVSFRKDIHPSAFASHLSFLKSAGQASPLHGTDDGMDIAHVYNSEITKGYAAKFSQDVLDMIRRRPEVEFVEQDQYAYAADVQGDAPWVSTAQIILIFSRICSSYVYPSYFRVSRALATAIGSGRRICTITTNGLTDMGSLYMSLIPVFTSSMPISTDVPAGL